MGRVWRFKRLKPDAYNKMKAEVLEFIMEHDDFSYDSVRAAFGGMSEDDLKKIIFELAEEPQSKGRFTI